MARIFPFFFALLALYAASALADERRVDELMARSGLDKQLVQVEAMMRAGIDEAQSQAAARGVKATMGAPELSRVKAAVATAFAPDVLRSACRESFAQRLTATDEAQVLAWLSTDLGQHIARIEEEEDHTSGPENARRADAAGRLFAALPRSRVALLKRLAAATMAGDAAAGMIISTTVGTTYGVAAATPPLDTTLVDALRKRMEAQRADMAAHLHELAVVAYGYTYRQLLNDELERYVAFAESSAGRHFHEAAIRGLEAAFARGSVQLGLELGTLEKRPETSNS